MRVGATASLECRYGLGSTERNVSKSTSGRMAKKKGLTKAQIKIFDAVCLRVSSGMSVEVACARVKGGSSSVIYRWLSAEDEEGGSLLRDKYARAKSDHMDRMVDEILMIADNQTGDVLRDRLRIDSRKWLASKLVPKKYGDQQRGATSADIRVTISARDADCG